MASLLDVTLSARLAVVLSFSFQVWRYSPTVAMTMVSAPSTAWHSPSTSMIGRSSAYAYFLEMVAGRPGM